ncbi:cytochrome P450 [Micromonospora zamorensis]|uniref:cytochrome P450 n=1 Tax=Micromonospora zamorensis TaxID=709883 RepID=UPI002ED3C69F|nr:cytochrome P450 [Micromonospora zamorensis]
MTDQRGPHLDDSLGFLLNGYAWLPALARRDGRSTVRTRVVGQPALTLRGPDAVRFFYDERHVRRHGAIPEPVQGTLFGHRAVHTLDGADHRHRKAMFLSLLTDPRRVADLVDHVGAAWNEAIASSGDGRRVVLFDEASRVITKGVCGWAGIPVDDAEIAPVARDLTALVDGFATVGPRHWRARRARGRREDWLAGLVEQVRAHVVTASAGSVLEAVAGHRDRDGEPLDPQLAAVELLNVIRPTVAVSWFVAFTAHALHRWPEHRDRLRTGDAAYAVAFAHEVRRFYPFAPFVGGRAVTDLTWQGQHVPAGSLVLLDIYGQNHDPALWSDPYRFDPQRFVGRAPDPYELIPQGGADRSTGHRCPGEDVTVALLAAFAGWLARLDYTVPEQDLTISLRRIPALPRSRFVLADVRRPDRPAEFEPVRQATPDAAS